MLTLGRIGTLTLAQGTFPLNISGATPLHKAGIPLSMATFLFVVRRAGNAAKTPPAHIHRPLHPGRR